MREMDDHGGNHILYKTENSQLDKVKKIWGRYVSQTQSTIVLEERS